MIFGKTIEYWEKRSLDLIRKATMSQGIKASCSNLSNYDAVFTRDAVMAGISGLMYNDEVIIKGFISTIENLYKTRGDEGQIASNFKIRNDKFVEISFGTLSPKFDSATWYLIGIGVLIENGYNFSIEYVNPTIRLLNALEYNNKDLIYVPQGGNWADEYPFEGYILYDQVLRTWALRLLGKLFDVKEWTEKAIAINSKINSHYFNSDLGIYNCSFTPASVNTTFDLAAHCLLGILQKDSKNLQYLTALKWISNNFLNNYALPCAFHPVIDENHNKWDAIRKFHLFDFKNKPHHYHNGGVWLIWIGWYALALRKHDMNSELEKLGELVFEILESLPNFNFEEYLSGDSMKVGGTPELVYSATGLLFLCKALKNNTKNLDIFLMKSTINIQEEIIIRDEYQMLSNEICQKILSKEVLPISKIILAIGGESGSGKTTTAICLEKALSGKGIDSTTIHMDSYFKLPPKENHLKRIEDLSHVGPQEIDMALLNHHLKTFKKGENSIRIPVLNYTMNLFTHETLDLSKIKVLIVEGVYSFLLEEVDHKIFMARSYKDTYQNRIARTRETYDPLVELILEIEHNIVSPLIRQSDFIINKDYSIVQN